MLHMYQAMPRDDRFKELFSSVISIYKIFKQKGCMIGYFSEENFKTKFNSSKRILQATVSIFCGAYVDSIFYSVIELEFNRGVNQRTPISDEELCELTLAKELVGHIRRNSPEDIYCMLTYFCSPDVRNELVPTVNWSDMPI